jgi:predicted RecA/RadA family phage recombinase
MGALNKITSGDCVVWENTTGSAVASQEVVVVGTSTLGIASEAIADNGFGTVDIRGVFELAALTAGVWDEGATLYWDASAEELTDVVAPGVYFFGFAQNAKTNGTTTAQAVLRPFKEEGQRVLVRSAATTLTAQDFYGGSCAVLTNTTSGTFATAVPTAGNAPTGAALYVHNTAGTNAATLSGGVVLSTIDAVNDRVVYVNSGSAWLQQLAVIA